MFLGIYEGQLRYFAIDGSLLASPQEAALKEAKIAEQERQLAQQSAAKLKELQDKMRSLGISID